jgi:asparagine synthetase B (glutamine-hydrolysing)
MWVKQLEARGPEGTKIVDVTDKVTLGFTRLAINGLTNAGMQPFKRGPVTWICNGEIYNSKEIEESLGLENTGSDCECIGPLYLRHRDDLVSFVRALDGVFAIALYDSERNRLIVTRDPFGVRPLFTGYRPNMSTSLASVNNLAVPFLRGTFDTFVFASELKALVPYFEHVSNFPPGTIQAYDVNTMSVVADFRYHCVNWITNPQFKTMDGFTDATIAIRYALEEAVRNF